MTLEDIDILKKLLIVCTNHQVKRIKWDNLELEFELEKEQNLPQSKVDTSIAKDRIPTEDELLFWSTNEQIDVNSAPPTQDI